MSSISNLFFSILVRENLFFNLRGFGYVSLNTPNTDSVYNGRVKHPLGSVIDYCNFEVT